jgi:hypothetical protein
VVQVRRDERDLAVEQFPGGTAPTADGVAAQPVRESRDEVEQDRAGPLGVIENHDQRATAGQSLKESADRPEALLDPPERPLVAGQRREPADDRAAVLDAVEEVREPAFGVLLRFAAGQAVSSRSISLSGQNDSPRIDDGELPSSTCTPLGSCRQNSLASLVLPVRPRRGR